jgi:predicted Zn-dependent protease
MSLKINVIAISGGFGACIALGIYAITLAQNALGQADGEKWSSQANIPHSCSSPRVGREIRSIAQQIRADGRIVISTVAPGMRLAERNAALHALGAAVNLWNSALNSVTKSPTAKLRPVQMVVSEDINDPDVQIEFSRVPYADGKVVAGSIRWQETSHRRGADASAAQSLSLTVGTFTSQGRPYSQNEIVNSIAHQFGHTLGLSDLPSTGGIMDSTTELGDLKSISREDFAELKRVLSGRIRENCRKQPDGRWIY